MSAEVYVVTEPERGAAGARESPLQVLYRMSLGTQVNSELPYQGDPSLSPPRSTEGDITPCLDLDPAKPVAKLVGQMHAQLSPSRGLVPGGVRVPPLSNNDIVVLGQWINQVGLEKLPLVQPKQVTGGQGVDPGASRSQDPSGSTRGRRLCYERHGYFQPIFAPGILWDQPFGSGSQRSHRSGRRRDLGSLLPSRTHGPD